MIDDEWWAGKDLKEIGCGQIEVPSWHLPTLTEEDHEEPVSGELVFRARFEPNKSWMLV
jgi:hypothetical protein